VTKARQAPASSSRPSALDDVERTYCSTAEHAAPVGANRLVRNDQKHLTTGPGGGVVVTSLPIDGEKRHEK
jgi:hypothetical protein